MVGVMPEIIGGIADKQAQDHENDVKIGKRRKIAVFLLIRTRACRLCRSGLLLLLAGGRLRALNRAANGAELCAIVDLGATITTKCHTENPPDYCTPSRKKRRYLCSVLRLQAANAHFHNAPHNFSQPAGYDHRLIFRVRGDEHKR